MKKYLMAVIIGFAFFSGLSFATNENFSRPNTPNTPCDECTGFGCYCAGMPHNCCAWCQIPRCDMIPSSLDKTT